MDFLDFRFDTIEKQGIINLCSYSRKGYAPVVLCDFAVTFLGEEEDATFRPLLCCALFICNSITEDECGQIFLSFIIQEVYRRCL